MRPGAEPATPPDPQTRDAFRALADAAPDAIVAIGAARRVDLVNPAAERMFGWSRREIVGQPIDVLMPDRLRAVYHDVVSDFVAERRPPQLFEIPARHADGYEFPVEMSLSLVHDPPDWRLAAIVRDLTSRRRRERHLAAQLAVTGVLAGRPSAQSTPELIVEALTKSLGWHVGALWMVEGDGRLHLRETWQAAPELTGEFVRRTGALEPEPPSGLVGATLAAAAPVWIDDLTAPEAPLRLPDAVAAGLRGVISLPLVVSGAPVGAFVCFTRELMGVDSRLRDLLMTVASQVGEHMRRLEAQERLDAELARSNRELEHFAHVAAHDLRGPLRTVTGLAQVLARRHRDALDDDGRELLDMIVANAQRGGRLLESLLEYARAGADVPLDEHVDTRAVVAEVLGALSAEVEQRGARVHVGALPPVRGNRVQIGQVFQNVIANALKYTPPERAPEVAVRGEPDGRLVRFEVTDNGIGLAPGDAEALFAMFRRGAEGGEFEGTGVGLAICARVVERHGGRIWAEPAPAQGTRFRFTLPADAG